MFNSFGEVLWEDPVNVYGLDFSKEISIKEGEIEVYKVTKNVPEGEGLNKPAILILKFKK